MLINSQPDMKVVAEAPDGRAGVQMAAETQPDVVVMDVSMPELNGIEATRQIVCRQRTARVLVVTANADARVGESLFAAGAAGLVAKVVAFEELALAIRTVAVGGIYVSPMVAEVKVPFAGPMTKPVFTVLSAREREVLQLVAEGFCTKEIANKLHVSVKTIETHRRSIMAKLDIDSVAELTKYALRAGITSLDAQPSFQRPGFETRLNEAS